MSMMTGSNVETFIKKHYHEVDETCEEHEVQLVARDNTKAFCPLCRLEKNKQEEQELSKKMTEKHLQSDKDWLTTRSIFIDESLKEATMDNYIADDEETIANKEMAKTIARGYCKGATYNSILSGKVGTGKSHLALSILKLVNEHHKEAPVKTLFVALDELLKRIRESFDNKESPHTEQNMTKMLSEVDLLVIDDLGSETSSLLNDKAATDFTTRILYSIFTARMTKPTIITTNLNSKGIQNKYDSRLVSRMYRGAKGNVITFKTTNDKRTVLDF